jgi:hypothetical protein
VQADYFARRITTGDTPPARTARAIFQARSGSLVWAGPALASPHRNYAR